MPNIEIFLGDIAGPLAVAAVAVLPIAIAIVVMAHDRKRYRDQADEPFTELPLRPPGESTRAKIEELEVELDAWLLALLLIGPTFIAMYGVSPHTRLTPYLFAATAVIGCAVFIHKLRRLMVPLRAYRLGYKGERVVGQELNQLLASGFRVFHDLPFEGFNVDHVIVGPPGVYAIETKTRRKPRDIKGKDRATVTFDGTTLHFPKGTDSKPIEQARRNARTLAEWLTRSTGESVKVNAILTFPGWWVDRQAAGDVKVLNSAEIKYTYRDRAARPLTPEQIQRICHQLTERCRMPKV